MTDLLKLICSVLASLFKSRAKLAAENLILRQQINVLRRRLPKRPHLNNTDRFLFVWADRRSASAAGEAPAATAVSKVRSAASRWRTAVQRRSQRLRVARSAMTRWRSWMPSRRRSRRALLLPTLVVPSHMRRRSGWHASAAPTSTLIGRRPTTSSSGCHGVTESAAAAGEGDDARHRRVHPPLPHPCATRRLPSHPPLPAGCCASLAVRGEITEPWAKAAKMDDRWLPTQQCHRVLLPFAGEGQPSRLFAAGVPSMCDYSLHYVAN